MLQFLVSTTTTSYYASLTRILPLVSANMYFTLRFQSQTDFIILIKTISVLCFDMSHHSTAQTEIFCEV